MKLYLVMMLPFWLDGAFNHGSLAPLTTHFDGEVVLYYSHFLKEFIKSFVVNDCCKLPPTNVFM
jgi:hypothetical protein